MKKILKEQSDWDKLLGFISDKKLTPIVGKEIYKFQNGNTLVPFDEYLSKELLRVNDVTDLPSLSLTQAVSYLVNDRKLELIDITDSLRDLVKKVGFEFPLLTKFLEITNLQYFINTSVYNNVLEQKLKEVRHVQEVNSINFSLRAPFRDCEYLEQLKQPFVFNVFGSLLQTVDPALSEELMLEFTGNFKEKTSNAANIINALKNPHLLFIGCAFPDWMVRFILRLLANEPLDEWGQHRKIIVVNDQSEERNEQFDFLRKHNVITYEGNTDDFIEELSTRWNDRNPTAPKTKQIFLSYTVKDRDAVETLKKALEGIGNISCWYDRREIIPGDDFDKKIAENIRSSDLFIPLISANSLQHKDGYIQKEWSTAGNVYTFRQIDGKTEKFFMPVVIDDTNPYDNNIPDFFGKLSFGQVPQGDPSPEFLNQVKETLFIA